MSDVLIVYATGEGQTAKVTLALEAQLSGLGHEVVRSELGSWDEEPDPADFRGVIVAASVHAGRHQKSVLAFVRDHREALEGRPTAFLSVSMSAGATKEAGRGQAREQVETFLKEAGWQPGQVEMVAGALRDSRLPWFKRLVTHALSRFFRKELDRLGWPADLRGEQELTDWDALARFGERFSQEL